jgi:hypothetical protein
MFVGCGLRMAPVGTDFIVPDFTASIFIASILATTTILRTSLTVFAATSLFAAVLLV